MKKLQNVTTPLNLLLFQHSLFLAKRVRSSAWCVRFVFVGVWCAGIKGCGRVGVVSCKACKELGMVCACYVCWCVV